MLLCPGEGSPAGAVGRLTLGGKSAAWFLTVPLHFGISGETCAACSEFRRASCKRRFTGSDAAGSRAFVSIWGVAVVAPPPLRRASDDGLRPANSSDSLITSFFTDLGETAPLEPNMQNVQNVQQSWKRRSIKAAGDGGVMGGG